MSEKKDSPSLYERKMKSVSDLEAIELDGLRQRDNDSPSPIRSRRKSFYSKSYNPEEAVFEDDDEIKLFPEKSNEVKTRLKSSITGNLLFKTLEPEQLSALIDVTKELTVKAGDELVKKGVENDYFFIIDSGEYEISEDSETKKVTSGTFGELSLLHSLPSEFSLRSITDGKIFILNKHDYRRIVTKTSYEIRSRLNLLLNKVLPLKDLSDSDKMKITDVLELKNYLDGETIVGEHDEANGLYLVESGSVDVRQNGIQWSVATGESFGELPVTKPSARFLAIARGPGTKVAFLRTEAFDRLMGPCLKVSKRKPKPPMKEQGFPSSPEFGDVCENV